MALGKNRERVNIKGGGVLEIKTDATWEIVGYLGGTHLVDETTVEDQHDETGEYVRMLPGNRKVTVETTLLQTNKDEVDLIRNNAGLDTVEARYRVAITESATIVWQLWAFGICQIVPKIDLNFAVEARRLPMTIILLPGTSTGKYYDMDEVDDPVEELDWPTVN